MLESMRLKCIACDHVMDDLIERAERDSLHWCPECGEIAMRRVFMAPAIRTSDSASHIDGSRKLTGVREAIALRKAASDAKKRNDKDGLKLISNEYKSLAKKD